MSLRHAKKLVCVDALEAPQGSKLDTKELAMADQLISIFEAPFEPGEYRERVMELIEAKQRGGSVKITPIRRRMPSGDLSKAPQASLKEERERTEADLVNSRRSCQYSVCTVAHRQRRWLI